MNKIKYLRKTIAFSWRMVAQSGKGFFFLYIFVRALSAGVPLLSTFLLKEVLDAFVPSSVSMDRIFLCLGLYLLLLVFEQGIASARDFLRSAVIQKAQHFYDLRSCEQLNLLSMEILDSGTGKDMIDRVRYAKVPSVLLIFRIVEAATLLYTFVIAFVTLSTFSVWFSFLFLALTVPGIILNTYYNQKAEDFREKTAPDVRKFSYYRWMLTDAAPAKDVRMYDLTESIKQRYDEEKATYMKENKRLDQKVLRGNLWIEGIKRSGEIVFTVYVILSAINGTISIGDVALYIGFSARIVGSFEHICLLFTDVCFRITPLMEKVLTFFEMKSAVSGRKKIQKFESLRFENVSFKYPNTDRYILSGASFALHAGEKLSIVGVNGAGKTTLVKLILGLYEIESGQILLNDCPIAIYDVEDVRKLFSVLFQNFVQYPLSLRENVALSDLDSMQNRQEILSALRRSGIYEEIKPKLENDVDSMMTRQFDDAGIELSKGQWQKIALARAYFKNAPIMILDEPSAALDAEAEDRIFREFEDISDGKTSIMITHRISAARSASKIIVLDGGRIAECGTHDELVQAGGLYAKLYQMQREKYVNEGSGEIK